MTKKTYILVEQFVDRAGRSVFFIHERSGEKRYYSPGKLVGQVRFKPDDEEFSMLEWVESEDE